VSPENVEPVRCFYAELASEGSPPEFDERLTGDGLTRTSSKSKRSRSSLLTVRHGRVVRVD
jgi:hypothetical protein